MVVSNHVNSDHIWPYFFKIKFVLFLYLRLSASWKENDLPLCIYFWYQTDSEVPNTSIYSAVSLASCWYCQSSNMTAVTIYRTNWGVGLYIDPIKQHFSTKWTEISSHVGWLTASSDTILKVTMQRMIQTKLGWIEAQ
jgi:hypothetical protein